MTEDQSDIILETFKEKDANVGAVDVVWLVFMIFFHVIFMVVATLSG